MLESLGSGPPGELWRRFSTNGFTIIVDILVIKHRSCLRNLKVTKGSICWFQRVSSGGDGSASWEWLALAMSSTDGQ